MASPGNYKGIKRADAARKSSKAGFDTYDTQDKYENPIDSVTVVRKDSDRGKTASENYKRTKSLLQNRPSRYGISKDISDSSIEQAAKNYAGISAKNDNPPDYKFFKHTQKDNK
jgi:hypothetical protein